MDRRSFLQGSMASLAGAYRLFGNIRMGAAAALRGAAAPRSARIDETALGDSLFPTNLKANEWFEFPAAGFSKPACGIIRRRKNPATFGMPLGSLDTGCLMLETDGRLGLTSIFNSFVPMRGPLKLPFLGITVGKQMWLLTTAALSSNESWYSTEGGSPSEIHYWGHFPVADLEYETAGSPVRVGLRAWSPFIPGDTATSNTPAAVFEVQLRNQTNTPQQGVLAFSFPGPTQEEVQIAPGSPRKMLHGTSMPGKNPHTWLPVAEREVRARVVESEGDFTGLWVSSELDNNVGYALGVVGSAKARYGAGLGGDGTVIHSGDAWSKIGTALPRAKEMDLSRSMAVDYQLQPGEKKIIRFVLAWYAPLWIGEGNHNFAHMYTIRFKNALEVAQFVSREHASLLRRVLAWQQVIYSETQYPVWLREALVNILHLFPICSFWAVAQPPIGDWCRKEDGLFGFMSGIIDWPDMEVVPDIFYANLPLVYFFPDLAVSEMRGYKAYQFPNGAAPWLWGGVSAVAKGGYLETSGTEMVTPSPGFQTTTNGPCYVDMVDRILTRVGNDPLLKEFYPSIKKNTIFTMGLRPEDGDDGIISVPTGNVDPYNPKREPGVLLEWFEAVQLYGMVTHVGGIHMAQLAMAERMANKMGDTVFARQCRAWLEAGSRSMEEKMWAGNYYLLYNEPRTGKKSDLVFGYQLDGQWMVKFHGLPGVFRADRVKATLETIQRLNASMTKYGASDVVTPQGNLAEGVGYGINTFFVPEVDILGATYMYEGEREFGLELIRRCQYALNIEWGYTWDQPNVIRGDSGQKTLGTFLVQNMLLWIVPAAAEGKDLAAFCAPGGFVDRILQAAKKS